MKRCFVFLTTVFLILGAGAALSDFRVTAPFAGISLPIIDAEQMPLQHDADGLSLQILTASMGRRHNERLTHTYGAKR